MKISSVAMRVRLGGFSLVEVTLAVGLTSFALLAIVGMMPVGLTTMRQAIDSTVESQITREIRTKVQQVPFSALAATFTDREFFFAESGAPTTKDGWDRRYTVRTSLEKPEYPGSDKAGEDSLSSISIEITTGEGETRTTRLQHLLVANRGGR